ncbi:MAG TPA: 50S ribosomal protein L25 [Patescibacteria group bacterium]|nr:50S ribosomal protein L25 [Patescibacteria group bacterium]
MKKHSLLAKARDTKKQKAGKLRKDGYIPGTVYGKAIKSESISVASKDFAGVYAQAHETGLVELSVDGNIRPVLIHHVQKDPVSEAILHVEFHQVDLKQKVKAAIPVVFVGESPAVAQKLGVLLTVLSDVEVEALPAELPEKIEVDVSRLETVDQELKVSDLTVPSGVTLLTDGALVIAKVGALVSKEAEAQAAAEAAAAAAAETPAEGTEAAPEEGEKPETAAAPAPEAKKEEAPPQKS